MVSTVWTTEVVPKEEPDSLILHDTEVPKVGEGSEVPKEENAIWFFEAFGQYGYMQAPTTPMPNGSLDNVNYGTKIDYDYPNTSGFSAGATVGYNFYKNLSFLMSYEYRNFSWRTHSFSQAFPASGAIRTGESSGLSRIVTSTIILGVRPKIEAFNGTLFTTVGVAAILPFSLTNESTYRTISTAYSTASSGRSESESEYNLSLGFAGSFGYQYRITERIYISASFSLLMFGASNNGRTTQSKSTRSDGTVSTSTYYNTDSYSLAEYDQGLSGNGKFVQTYNVIFPNDMGIRISLGYCF